MKVTFFATAAASSLVAAINAAYAGEGNGDPFAFRAPGLTTSVPQVYTADTGSAAYPNVSGRPSWEVAAGGIDEAPSSGSEGTVQTANSLPRGFAEGTVAYAQAGVVRQYFAEQAARQARIIQTARIPGSEPRG